MSQANYGFGSGFDEVQQMTPAEGFNVCTFDELAHPGEHLTIVAHTETWEEALKEQEKYQMMGETVYIYPQDEGMLKIQEQAPADIQFKPKETPKLKIRELGRYIYKNKGSFSKHQERSADHICSMLDGTVWEMKDPRRPILPSEHLGITNTHPNCVCEWQTYKELVEEPDAAKILKPTKNGKPLEDLKWNGKALQHIGDVDLHIEQQFKKGTLHFLDKDGGLIREAVMEIKKEFQWLSPIYFQKLKQADIKDGKFLVVRAAAESITDHRKEGEPYRRKLTARELLATTRTGIGKGADINHVFPKKDVNRPPKEKDTIVVDAEFDDGRKEMQFLVFEKDKEILNGIRDGKITAVSINAGKARQEFINCEEHECFLVPTGLILGENDNIAFTYVITAKEGMMYNGSLLPPAIPGIKTTAIEILE